MLVYNELTGFKLKNSVTSGDIVNRSWTVSVGSKPSILDLNIHIKSDVPLAVLLGDQHSGLVWAIRSVINVQDLPGWSKRNPPSWRESNPSRLKLRTSKSEEMVTDLVRSGPFK